MIRPELQKSLTRWREALFGAGVVALGLWLALVALPGIALLGYVIALLGGQSPALFKWRPARRRRWHG
jgi:hypothetical protein